MILRACLVVLALAAAPAARAAAPSWFSLEGGAPEAPVSFGFPELRLGAPSAVAAELAGAELFLDLDDGSGARRRRGNLDRGTQQVLAFVLGIIPGFGLGHLVANSSQWPMWLLIDVALLVTYVLVDDHDLETLIGVATVVERVLEGLDAFRSAGGSFASLGDPATAPARAYARPLRDPAAAGFRP